MTLDFIVPMLILLEWRTNIPFLNQILDKLSKLSGGREEIVLIALFILLVLFLLFIRRVIRKRRQKEALQYHIEEKDRYHISMEKQDLHKLISLLIEGLGGRENILSVRFDAKKLKIKIKEYALVQENTLRMAGFPGVVRPSKDEVHLLIGDEAGELCEALQNLNI